jgi:nucleoside-diphosphate-sugar epimerase
MRFDLIINTMYKCALLDGKITVNNASLWRPILDLRDAVAAYLRAIQADYGVSGIFNVASDNCTVGHVADRVKETMQNALNRKIAVDIKHIQDLRNYKVSIGRAKTILGFEPMYRVEDIVRDVHDHRDEYPNLDLDEYYNIRVFKKLPPAA